MRCPFLREAQAKTCQASAVRKLIVRGSGDLDHERCSSPAFRECPAMKEHEEEHPHASRCPFLQESLMQYCSAAPMQKYIPYTESIMSRCGNDNHRFCEVYRGVAHPPGAPDSPAEPADVVEGVRVPHHLHFAPNHLWLDVSDDGSCHVGVDTFLIRMIGAVDRISFVTTRGLQRPVAVFTVRGVDLQLVFPNPMEITRTNAYLRADAHRLAGDPYGIGWLFEGTAPRTPQGSGASKVTDGLLSGSQASAWMREEVHRAGRWVHEYLRTSEAIGTTPVMMDGGSFAPGFARSLERDDLLHLFNDFFAAYAPWRKP
jgi:glycine cleavage system H lipoate-binding protein